MNVIFMGTPDFAVPCLEKLIKKHNVIAVFSQPDKPVGRKQILTPPAVKKCANEHKIDVFQPNSLKDNVVFPVVDMVLAVLFFVKVGTAYFDYKKHGQFEFTAPAILFACLIFTLTAPLYIWGIVGM